MLSFYPRSSVDAIRALRDTSLFDGLPDSALQSIAERAITRRLGKDELLFSQNEEARGLYVVIEGELRSVRQTPDGRQQVVSTAGAGAVLAEEPIFDGCRTLYTAIAECPSVVLFIEKRYVHQFCRDHPEVFRNLARDLSHALRRDAELIETLALRSVDQRLARYVLALVETNGIRSEGGSVVELTATRHEIAMRLGSVREVISRSFAHLQQSGLIMLNGRLVIVPDIRTLREFAGAETSVLQSVPTAVRAAG